MKEWNWGGSRWWKFDFHTHTPASHDYGKASDQANLKEHTPREWLLDYMLAGIDCVAITDHNSGEWIDRVKDELDKMKHEQPAGFRDLYVFPGVEISVHGGVHLLAIFGCDKITADIDSLLGKVHYNGDKGSSNSVTRLSLPEVIDEINSVGAIAIPAHVDKEKGLFKALQGTTLEQALDNQNVFAIELNDLDYKKPEIYTNKKLDWTEVLGSDSHHPPDTQQQKYPGSHFTWVKMGIPCIEGLRLALLDGPLSVIRSDKAKGNPNEHAKMVLESMEISDARYFGRANPFKIKLNPWLNSLIGGRGTGKSTLVEFLRIALRRMDELPESLKEEFEKYQKVYLDRHDGGLLTENTRIKAIYRKDDSKFRIQWNHAGNLDSIEEYTDKGNWKRTVGDIRQLFPVRIYSQKQIFDLANKPLALLRIVDEAQSIDRHSWDEKWTSSKGRFLSLRLKYREIDSRLSEESRLRGELEDIKRKQRIFERARDDDVLQSFQKLRRQELSIKAWEKSWTDIVDRLQRVADDMIPDSLDSEIFNEEVQADAELQGHAATVCQGLEELSEETRSIALRASRILDQWRTSKDESSWKKNTVSVQQAYEKLPKDLADGEETDPVGYGMLVQRRQSIEMKLEELEGAKKRIKELGKQIEEQLGRMIEIRRELTEGRRNFLNEVLNENQYIRIRVVPYGATDTVEEEFRQLLQKNDSTFERDIGSPDGGGLLGNLYNSDSNTNEDFEKKLAKLKHDMRSIKSGAINQVADQRFAAHISNLNPEAFDHLDAWFPEDSLDVQYNATGAGDNFLSIKEGSPGQKTAALLAFLLSYGDEPLILDQPEDDLDNLLIYDLIVTQLRSMKRYRQIIVVTHNANIVVNGDSELVVALAPRCGESQKECYGSLQERDVREKICQIMEGGSKAFEDRYRRIAPGKDNV